jgi:superfamily II DNA or RNA helicase
MSKVYEKLKQIRKATELKLKPSKRLKTHLTLPDGAVVPFSLRDYQVQMVMHMLYCPRFVVGDDTGLGKCVTGDTLISTDQGWMPIADMYDWSHMAPDSFEPIQNGPKVLLDGKALPLKNFYYGGIKPTYKLRTAHGFALEGSHVHPVRIWRQGMHQWATMDTLELGDHVCISRQNTSQHYPPYILQELDFEDEENLHQIRHGALEDLMSLFTHDYPIWKGEVDRNTGTITLRLDGHELAHQIFQAFQLALLGHNILSTVTDDSLVLDEANYSKLEYLREGHTEPFSGELPQDSVPFFGAPVQRLLSRLKHLPFPCQQNLWPDQDSQIYTREQLQMLVNAAEAQGIEDDDVKALREASESDYIYDPIVSLDVGRAEVFDIEVDHPSHAFVANGIVNHNTLETLAGFCYIWEVSPDLVPIIVTTKSALRQWGSEVSKFMVGVTPVIVSGTPKKRMKIYEEFITSWDAEAPQILIMTYGTMRNDEKKLQAKLKDVPYMIAFDECTAVKNPKTATHINAKRLSLEAKRAYGITATLIKNNLYEGFGIYGVIKPEVFPSDKGFKKQYCITKMQKLKNSNRRIETIVGHSKAHVEAFRERISPFYFGRAKHLVATELPLLTTKEITLPMTTKQWRYYTQAVEGMLEVNQDFDMVPETSLFEESDEPMVETSHLTKLIYCQEIVDDLHLIGNEGTSAKVDALLELLDTELAGEKVIVFTRFRKMVDRIQTLLEARGYQLGIQKGAGSEWDPSDVERGMVRVTGAESSYQRDAARRAFTETENTNTIFLTMAGAEAINLQQARVMVFFDLPWSAGDYLQLIGRMIRIGSPHNSVYAIHMISEGPWGEPTIDRYVGDTLNKKMTVLEGVLGKRILNQEESEEGEFLSTQSEHLHLLNALMAQHGSRG